MGQPLKSRRWVRAWTYIIGALLGSLVGYAFDHMLYAEGGTALMKFGAVLGLCLAYVVLGPAPKRDLPKETEE